MRSLLQVDILEEKISNYNMNSEYLEVKKRP